MKRKERNAADTHAAKVDASFKRCTKATNDMRALTGPDYDVEREYEIAVEEWNLLTGEEWAG